MSPLPSSRLLEQARHVSRMMKLSANLSSLLLLAEHSTACTPTAHDPTRLVTYIGLERNGIDVFLNIPFGADTGGANRFRPPQPYYPGLNTTVIAQSPGPACMQAVNVTPATRPNSFTNVTHVSEDCLNLNVARPHGTSANASLPVMVFIYGGGFWEGQANDARQAPDALVLQSVDNGLPVIHVNFNYRLGVFGFAISDALKAEGATNAGLRDQRLALEWIRDNIAYFGGDPSRVTIFGQSSGGLGVGMQILAYGGMKAVPFQRAVCHSQALEPGITGNFTVDAMRRVAAYTGCNTTASSDEEAACLRALDAQRLFEAARDTFAGEVSDNIGDIWLPAVDGDFVPAAPSTLVREGRFAPNISAMVGWCEDDMAPFTDRSITQPEQTRDFVSAYLPALTEETLDELLELYPPADFFPNVEAGLSPEFYRTARIWRDILMTCMPIGFASALAEKNYAFADGDAAGVYLFDWNQTVMGPAYAANGLPGVGVFHTSDLEYVYGNVSKYNKTAIGYPFEPLPSDYVLQDQGTRSWSTFATLGQPGLEGHETFVGWSPAWEQGKTSVNDTYGIYVAGGPHRGFSSVDGPGADEAVAQEKLRERCAFFNRDDVVAQMQY